MSNSIAVLPPVGRLAQLFLRQRAMPLSVLALALHGAALVWLETWVAAPGQDDRAVMVLVALPALVACIVGIGLWAPAADLERTSAWPLPWLRAIHVLAVGVAGLATAALATSRWDIDLAGGIPYTELWLRNAIGLTGLTLIAARLIDPRLSWLGPLMFSIVAVVYVSLLADDPATSENERLQPPAWIFTGQDHRSLLPWVLAIMLLAAGLALIARYGPKEIGVTEV